VKRSGGGKIRITGAFRRKPPQAAAIRSNPPRPGAIRRNPEQTAATQSKPPRSGANHRNPEQPVATRSNLSRITENRRESPAEQPHPNSRSARLFVSIRDNKWTCRNVTEKGIMVV
jgi:hypothetical protein